MTSIIILLITIACSLELFLVSICRKLDVITKNLEVIREIEHCLCIQIIENQAGVSYTKEKEENK